MIEVSPSVRSFLTITVTNSNFSLNLLPTTMFDDDRSFSFSPSVINYSEMIQSLPRLVGGWVLFTPRRVKVYKPIWHHIRPVIHESEQLQQTHSVPNHRRSNTSWRTRRNTISRRNNINGQAVYRHRFTWSRTCLKAFRALPDQKGRRNLI